MRATTLCGWALVVVLEGCKSAPTAAPVRKDTKLGNVTHHCSTPVVVETPIVYDTMGQPMVRAKVGGVDTRLLLDTGASTHLLTLDLATRATLPVLFSNSGTDHAGANVPSWEVGEVSVQIQDRVLFLHGAVTFNGPPAFAKKRIGGALSPQHLHPSALVILDFVGGPHCFRPFAFSFFFLSVIFRLSS